MALTPERIMELSDRLLRVVGAGYVRPQDADGFARAIESEVRKDDEALIQQLVEALDEATTYTASAMWSPSMTNECKELVAKGRARLDGKS
jgi:hypothetical protein